MFATDQQDSDSQTWRCSRRHRRKSCTTIGRFATSTCLRHNSCTMSGPAYFGTYQSCSPCMRLCPSDSGSSHCRMTCKCRSCQRGRWRSQCTQWHRHYCIDHSGTLSTHRCQRCSCIWSSDMSCIAFRSVGGVRRLFATDQQDSDSQSWRCSRRHRRKSCTTKHRFATSTCLCHNSCMMFAPAYFGTYQPRSSDKRSTGCPVA